MNEIPMNEMFLDEIYSLILNNNKNFKKICIIKYSFRKLQSLIKYL